MITEELLLDIEAFARAEIAACPGLDTRMTRRARATLELVKCHRFLAFRTTLESWRAENVGTPPFTLLFSRALELLELTDQEAAALLDTSVPNVSRWRKGVVVPPAAPLVLKFLQVEFEQRLRAGSLG